MEYCRFRKYTQELHKNTEFLTEISSQDTESLLSTNSNKDGKSAISYCGFSDDQNTSKWISTQHCSLKP